MDLVFVTSNAGKLQEVKKLMEDVSAVKLSHQGLDLPELQGEPEEIARAKCALAATKLGKAVIVEDTSLCFEEMKGLPGPYIRSFLEKLGHPGLVKLALAFDPQAKAYAQCIFGLCLGPGEEVELFVGRTYGKIVEPRHGERVFGWDPIFQPQDEQGEGKTYAEMSMAVKNSISHRGRALSQLVKRLHELN